MTISRKAAHTGGNTVSAHRIVMPLLWRKGDSRHTRARPALGNKEAGDCDD